MSEETLFTAARRAVRYFNIDMGKGGLICEATEQALKILDDQVEKERRRLKEQVNVIEFKSDDRV